MRCTFVDDFFAARCRSAVKFLKYKEQRHLAYNPFYFTLIVPLTKLVLIKLVDLQSMVLLILFSNKMKDCFIVSQLQAHNLTNVRRNLFTFKFLTL